MTTSPMTRELRQGDICEIDAFPLWDLIGTLQTTQSDGRISHLMIPEFKRCAPSNVTPGKKLVAVCSYDCDIENPRGRSGLLIAPLIGVKTSHRDYARLAACGEPIYVPESDTYTYQFVNHFPYSGVRALAGDAAIAELEFSAMTTVGPAAAAAETLLKSKVHEISDEDRLRLQKKLAVFTSRIEAAA